MATILFFKYRQDCVYYARDIKFSEVSKKQNHKLPANFNCVCFLKNKTMNYQLIVTVCVFNDI